MCSDPVQKHTQSGIICIFIFIFTSNCSSTIYQSWYQRQHKSCTCVLNISHLHPRAHPHPLKHPHPHLHPHRVKLRLFHPFHRTHYKRCVEDYSIECDVMHKNIHKQGHRYTANETHRHTCMCMLCTPTRALSLSRAQAIFLTFFQKYA